MHEGQGKLWMIQEGVNKSSRRFKMVQEGPRICNNMQQYSRGSKKVHEE